MSCNCNNSQNNLPCCCPTVTTTTTAFELCEGGTPCETIYLTDCVVYTGDPIELECITILPGQTYTEILETIMSQLPSCINN